MTGKYLKGKSFKRLMIDKRNWLHGISMKTKPDSHSESEDVGLCKEIKYDRACYIFKYDKNKILHYFNRIKSEMEFSNNHFLWY